MSFHHCRKTSPALALLLVALPLAGARTVAARPGSPTAAHPAAGNRAGQDRPSLQELLAELRAERARLFAARKQEISIWVEQLELHGNSRTPPADPEVMRSLRELGDEFAPLLLLHLDPDSGGVTDSSLRGRVYRSQKIVETLQGMDIGPIVGELLAAARGGSLGAIEVLAAAPERDRQRVFAELRLLLEKSLDPSRRVSCLTALVTLGGPELGEVLRQTLSSDDDDLVATSLQALVRSEARSALPWVVEFVRSDGSSPHLNILVDYFLLFEEVDEEHGAALLEIATRNDVNLLTRIRAVERMRKVAFDDRGEVRDVAKKLERSASSDMREAIQVLLAYKGDNGAERDLLRRLDERIDDDPTMSSGYTARAEIYYKIGEYRKALKDYKEALELQARRVNDRDTFIGVARCYALLGQFKSAADYLSKAPLTRSSLNALARDPDFAEMAADSRYSAVFGLSSRD